MRYEVQGDLFELQDVFDNGQCFRWNRNEDGSYNGVFHNISLNVKKSEGKIIFEGITKLNQKEFESEIVKYFDLERDYESYRDKLSIVDDNLKVATEFGKGLRLLNQDLFETIISYITSANNNIPRIKGIIHKMCEKYGKELEDGTHAFPTIEELSKAEVEDLRALGLGFRDKYIYKTTKYIKENPTFLPSLYNMDTEKCRKALESLEGVGPKVADCILLFSDLKRMDVFPIDVWVRRVMNELYFHTEEVKLSKKEIRNMAELKFGELQGLAQQYLFYWRREL
jgi:N-glycosylase/DNA lyase